jgi:serine/threonine-protein kinase mTOR
MRVIRENKESLLAVLEAFIHDPLLNWRLNTRESPPRPHFRSERRASIVDVPGRGGLGDEERSPIEHAQYHAIAGEPPQSQVGAPPGRRHRRSSILDPAMGGGSVFDAQKVADGQTNTIQEKEVQNQRALQVLARIKDKLTGKDFGGASHGVGGVVANGANGNTNGHVNGDTGTVGEALMAEAGGLSINEQVEKLIEQATKVENLCQHYIGWCSFW